MTSEQKWCVIGAYKSEPTMVVIQLVGEVGRGDKQGRRKQRRKKGEVEKNGEGKRRGWGEEEVREKMEVEQWGKGTEGREQGRGTKNVRKQE